MNKHEPIRHHYVPRFLLKPFCFEGTKINYYDKKAGTFSVKDIKNVFVEKNFYRDDINNGNDPMKLEKDFSKFESDVSRIFRKFLIGKDIIISVEEYEEMQFFFALMMFRGMNGSPIVMRQPYKFFERFCERTGMRFVNIHSFRHFNATILINNGVDIRTVQDCLGHSCATTTLNIYAHTFQEAQARAIQTISSSLQTVMCGSSKQRAV